MPGRRFDIVELVKSLADLAPEQETRLGKFLNTTWTYRVLAAALLLILGATLSWYSLLGNVIAAAHIRVIFYITACVIAGLDVLYGAVHTLVREHRLEDEFLMAVAAVLAVLCGQAASATVAVILFRFLRAVMRYAAREANEDSDIFVDFLPACARLVSDSGVELREVPVVGVGSSVLVRPGERIPLDGIVRSGSSVVDASDLYGIKQPREVTVGDEVLSGTLNTAAQLTIEVTKNAGDSTGQRMLEVVDGALRQPSRGERRVHSLLRKLVPILILAGAVVIAAIGILAKLSVWDCVGRFSLFLAVLAPGTLLFTIPVLHFSHFSRLCRAGTLIRDVNAVDGALYADHVFFNKTGTLTTGKYEIVGIAAHKLPREQLLKLVACVEHGVRHPIAEAVARAAGETGYSGGPDNRTEVPGAGIYAVLRGNDIHIGSKRLMDSIDCPVKSYGDCEFYVAINREYAGTIVMEESIRESAYGLAAELHNAGVRQVGVLSSCDQRETKRVADAIGFDAAFGDLRSDEKLARLEYIRGENDTQSIAYVGRGLNDGAAMAYADAGILLSSEQNDLSVKTPDIVLMNDDLHGVARLRRAAKDLKEHTTRALLLMTAVKAILLLLALLGAFWLWLFVMLDCVAAIAIAILLLSSLRAKEI